MDAEISNIIATIEDETLTRVGHTYTMRNGVVLSMRKVSPRLAQMALDKLAEPPIPKVFIEDKETWEENPMDPDYIDAVQEYTKRRGLLIQDIYLARGTEIKDLHGIDGPENDSWIADAEFLGIKITNQESPMARHLQWLYFIMEDMDELQAVLLFTECYNGLIPEVQVLEEMYYFRHPQERAKSTGDTDTEATPHTDLLPESGSRDGVGVRTEGSGEVLSTDLQPIPISGFTRASEGSSPL